MAKSDYIPCDVCDCKLIYDGEWRVRDCIEEEKITATFVCFDCMEKSKRQPAPGEEGR